jgi:hypothetical protein
MQIADAITSHMVTRYLNTVVVAASERAVNHSENSRVIGSVCDDVEAITRVGRSSKGTRWYSIGREPTGYRSLLNNHVV